MATPPLPHGLNDDRVHRTANQLHSMAIHLLRRARVADHESGLTPERLSLLSVLAFAGPRTIGQLADAEWVSRPAISRIVSSLEDAGLVKRDKTKTDRRLVVVHATANGKKLMDVARRARLELIATELAPLDPTDLSILEQAGAVLESLGGRRPRRNA